MSKRVEKNLELDTKRVENHRKRRRESMQASVDCNQPSSSNEFIDDNKIITESLNCFDDLHASLRQFYEFENNLNDRFSSCSESESDGDESSTETPLKVTFLISELKIWALKHKVTHSCIDGLLQILKPYHSELPLSAKTLLKCNSILSSLVKKVNPDHPQDMSEYVYFGIRRNLERIVNVALHKDKVLELLFNMDGLPLFKSSSLEFWPILGKIFSTDHYEYKPFIISIYSGFGKPQSFENYLSDFIEEINNLLKNGIEIKGYRFQIKVKCFICDRPARAFIKCIKGHNGYFACERCKVEGESYKNRIIYNSIGDKRTNQSFRQQKDPQHHEVLGAITASPLLCIDPPIDLVYQFILDIMHLIFLGVKKKNHD